MPEHRDCIFTTIVSSGLTPKARGGSCALLISPLTDDLHQAARPSATVLTGGQWISRAVGIISSRRGGFDCHGPSGPASAVREANRVRSRISRKLEGAPSSKVRRMAINSGDGKVPRSHIATVRLYLSGTISSIPGRGSSSSSAISEEEDREAGSSANSVITPSFTAVPSSRDNITLMRRTIKLRLMRHVIKAHMW